MSGKFFEKLLSGEIFGNLLIARSFLKVTFFHVKKVTKCHDSIHKFLAFVLLTISLVGLFFFLHVFFFFLASCVLFYCSMRMSACEWYVHEIYLPLCCSVMMLHSLFCSGVGDIMLRDSSYKATKYSL